MKLVELRSDLNDRLKKNPELKRKMEAISKLQWIETSYDLDTAFGREVEPLSAEEIQNILKGDYVESRTVKDHMMVRNYYDMVKYVYGVLPLKNKVDVALAEKINTILCRDEIMHEEGPCYRKSVPIVKEFDIIPPHHQNVERDLREVVREYNVIYDQLNPILRACFIHNEFLKVYPFFLNNEATAKALMNFELMAGGYLPVSFGMDKEVFRDCVIKYIHGDDPKPFYEMLVKEEKRRYTQFLEMEA